jgi:hypothetical protein
MDELNITLLSEIITSHKDKYHIGRQKEQNKTKENNQGHESKKGVTRDVKERRKESQRG